jgi:hypothetical protein
MAPAAIGPVAGWILAGPADAAAVASSSLAAVRSNLLARTVRAACQFGHGRAVATSLVSTTSLVLTKGALRSMTLEKLIHAAWLLVPAGALTIAAGTMLAQDSVSRKEHGAARNGLQDRGVAEPSAGGRNERARSERTTEQRDDGVQAVNRVAPEFKQPTPKDLVEAASRRLDAQRAYYEEGRITLDRYIAASQQLMLAEHSVAKTDADRHAALQRHVDRLKEVEKRERTEMAIGKGTIADVLEAVQNRVEAEIQLKPEATANPSAQIEVLSRRLADVERKLDQLLKQQGGANRR